ncbi:MAG TPA: hydroxysqualene dehydroxylase HpnE [Burkholderiaceae bacterium]
MEPPAPRGRDAPRTVAVIGGGWAGLSAAVEATRLGHEVTLFEMAPQLGGRSRGVEIAGQRLDNGQHILIGAYSATLGLMRALGVDVERALLRTPLRLLAPDGSGLALPPGAPILAFARGVLAQRGWRLAERVALLAAAGGWARRRFQCDDALTVAALTARLPAAVRAQLIEPLCVAALNTPAAEASARVFLRVLHDALFAGAGSADLLLPRVSLDELLPGPAQQRLAPARLRLHTRVASLRAHDGHWLVDEERFDQVVLAATPTESARLAAEIAPAWSQRASSLRYEPIVTVYLRSAGTRLAEPLLALRSDAKWPAQFVFDRGQLGGPEGLLAFVISGAQPWVDLGLDATAQAAQAQARALLGAQLRGPLERVHTIAEKRATFRCTPGLQRPAMHIAPGLWAAGDHVAGPYPATLEGAVRSGLQVAALL